VCGEHKHKLGEKEIENHILVGRLKPKEKEFVHEMSSNLVPLRNILSTLKDQSKESKTAITKSTICVRDINMLLEVKG
jgi:hypothetical protein